MKKLYVLILSLTLVLSGTLFAQQKEITGKVTTEEGSPLPGVTIIVKGTALGTFTKSDGTYSLKVPATAKTLVFKQVGMKSKEINIGDKTVINVSLEEDKVLMDEVVVTAIGLERNKKSLGYSVEEVSDKLISESKAVNMVNALSGKVAGVNVNNSAGTPGASSFINIRGVSSITGNNQPLFIVDGVPIDNSMDYSGNPDNGRNNLLDGVAYSNRAIDINPDDIASVTVLKGPAATALYGLRASSGAIVITTKKGESYTGEKANISFTSSISADEVNKMPELQNIYSQGSHLYWDYGYFPNPYSELGTNFPSMSWGSLIDTLRYDGVPNKWDKNGGIVGMSDPNATNQVVNSYDNVDNFFRTGYTYTNSLSMAGGSSFGSYYLSISNSTTNGIIPNSEFGRTNIRIAGDARIASNFKASGAVNYVNSGGTRIQQGSNVSGVMLGLLRTPPNFDNSYGYGEDAIDNEDAYIFDDGTQRNYRGGAGGYDNPFWTANRNPFEDNVDRVIGHFQLNYYIADWIDIMYRLGADIYTDSRKQIFSINSNAFPSGQVTYHDITNSDINSDLIVTLTHKFNEDLNAKLLLGNNLYSTNYYYHFTQGDGLIIPDFYHISNASGKINRESDQELRRLAFYADLTLDYQEWLYLNGALRNEMSTSLPEDNNSFMYGSGNLSVVFTEALEDIFMDTPLSFGKLRLSYAVVGKDAPIYATTTPFIPGTYGDGWTSGISFPFSGQVGYSAGDVLGNDLLEPEMTTSFELGFALNFFDNLFGLDYTYYNSNSVDQIFNVPVAYSSGYWRQVMNAGELSNVGHEIVLNANPIVTPDFSWNIAVNFATNENMVEKLAEGVDNIFLGGFQGSSVRAVAGKTYGSIFGFGWLRDDNGNVIVDDQEVLSDGSPNGNYGYPILDPDEKDFGSAAPDWTMGIRNSVSWEGITFSFLFDIRSGGVLWNGTKGALYFFGTHKDTEIRGTTKVFDGVKGHVDETSGEIVSSGQANDIEADMDEEWLAFGNGNGFVGSNTEDFIEDAGWVRLREISLSYQLPASITDMLPFADVIITLTGRNLWLSTDYTGIDPETSLMGAHNAQGIDYFNMPGTKTYSASINVKL